MSALLRPSGSWATASSMDSARSTATDGDSSFEGIVARQRQALPDRYGSKPLGGQQNECMFCLLNNGLDPRPPTSYDPPVLRIAVRHGEHVANGICYRGFVK